MKKSAFYALLLVLLCCGSSYGQRKDSSVLWTLTDCFRYAAAHNFQINTLRLNGQSAEQDLIAARGARLPSLSASIGNTFNNANNSDSGGRLINQLTSSSTYLLNSSIVLWNDNFINNNIRQQELIVQSAQLTVQQSLNSLTLTITQDFLAILLARENLKYVSDLVRASEAKVKQGQLFYDAGSIAKKDLLLLQSQLAEDQFLLVQTQNSIRQNTLVLKQELQLPTEVSFDIIIPDSVVVEPTLRPLAEAQQKALHDFPDLQIGQLGMEIANLGIAKAKASFKPQLSASGTLGTGYNDVLTNAVNAKTSWFTQTRNNFFQRAGFVLTIPIFSNYLNKTELAKARISFEAARLGYQNDRLLLLQAVEQAYLNASNDMKAYQAANAQFAAVTENYRIANEQFRLGGINSYDLLQQRNQYIQAVQAFTQAKYTAVLQQKIYAFYLGKPITLESGP